MYKVGDKVKIVNYPNIPSGFDSTPRIGEVGYIHRTFDGLPGDCDYEVRFNDGMYLPMFIEEFSIVEEQMQFPFMYEED